VPVVTAVDRGLTKEDDAAGTAEMCGLNIAMGLTDYSWLPGSALCVAAATSLLPSANTYLPHNASPHFQRTLKLKTLRITGFLDSAHRPIF
jgi:hypothetical protein